MYLRISTIEAVIPIVAHIVAHTVVPTVVPTVVTAEVVAATAAMIAHVVAIVQARVGGITISHRQVGVPAEDVHPLQTLKCAIIAKNTICVLNAAPSRTIVLAAHVGRETKLSGLYQGR